MRRHPLRARAALTIAMLVVAGRTISAQAQSGWPDVPAAGKPAKSAVTKTVTAAVPAKPAATRVATAPPPPTAKAAAKAAPATVASAPAAAAAPVAVESPWIAGDEVVRVLQQQSDVLTRLAAELQSQRSVIKEQQDKIASLELKLSAPAPVAAPVAAPPPPPITVDTNGIKLRVSGLFQGWYSASDASIDTFRLRRAELKFAGEISPRIRWAVMVDPAKALALSTTTTSMGGQTILTGTSIAQSGRIIQDAFVSLNWKPALSFEVGQQKLPLGNEGTVSSAKLDTVERALFITDKARGGGYADIRDFGLMVRGKVTGGQVEYAGGVFNGLGENFNDVDRNEQKAMVGRVIVRPAFAKGLQIGASASREEFQIFDNQARERQGLDVAYARGVLGLKAEYMGGRDALVTRQGGYAQMTTRIGRKLTAIGRYDTWDPDTRTESTAATVTEHDYLGGFTYVLHPSGVWLQANYIRKTFEGVSPSRHVFLTNVQTAW